MKYQIGIEERVVYSHSVIVEVGSDVSEGDLSSILDEAEEGARDIGWAYIQNVLERKGINVIDIIEDDSGSSGDIEIVSMDESD